MDYKTEGGIQATSSLLLHHNLFPKGPKELQALPVPHHPSPSETVWPSLFSSHPVTYPEKTTPIGLSHPDTIDLSDQIPTTVGYFPWSLSTLYAEAGSLPWTQSLPVWLTGLLALRMPCPCLLYASIEGRLQHLPSFYFGAEDSNSISLQTLDPGSRLLHPPHANHWHLVPELLRWSCGVTGDDRSRTGTSTSNTSSLTGCLCSATLGQAHYSSEVGCAGDSHHRPDSSLQHVVGFRDPQSHLERNGPRATTLWNKTWTA